ncbi:MAG: hypothetical protein JOZ78_13565 [Chroococcidiopsidaceae cyanobacterium CP_BM_ER_R8_30]|nr:hypothetical protein [Chroococcidiopsidaceae cyanobacterium CP_BM_ER_R8_30]
MLKIKLALIAITSLLLAEVVTLKPVNSQSVFDIMVAPARPPAKQQLPCQATNGGPYATCSRTVHLQNVSASTTVALFSDGRYYITADVSPYNYQQ